MQSFVLFSNTTIVKDVACATVVRLATWRLAFDDSKSVLYSTSSQYNGYSEMLDCT